MVLDEKNMRLVIGLQFLVFAALVALSGLCMTLGNADRIAKIEMLFASGNAPNKDAERFESSGIASVVKSAFDAQTASLASVRANLKFVNTLGQILMWLSAVQLWAICLTFRSKRKFDNSERTSNTTLDADAQGRRSV